MHVERSSLEKYFLFPYKQTKKNYFQTFPGWKMTKTFPYFSRLGKNPTPHTQSRQTAETQGSTKTVQQRWWNKETAYVINNVDHLHLPFHLPLVLVDVGKHGLQDLLRLTQSPVILEIRRSPTAKIYALKDTRASGCRGAVKWRLTLRSRSSLTMETSPTAIVGFSAG